MARATAIVAAAAATLLLGWLFVIGPFLSAPTEDLVSTPGLAGLYERQEVGIPPRGIACTSDVMLAAPADRVRYLVAGNKRTPAGIGLTVTGNGFKARGATPEVSAAGPDSFLTIPFSPAAGERAQPARFCLSAGRRPLRLVGTSEGNSAVRASTSVNGKAIPVDISLALLGSGTPTRWDAIREVPDRIASATGIASGPAITVFAVAVLLLMLVAPPLALVAADRRRPPK